MIRLSALRNSFTRFTFLNFSIKNAYFIGFLSSLPYSKTTSRLVDRHLEAMGGDRHE